MKYGQATTPWGRVWCAWEGTRVCLLQFGRKSDDVLGERDDMHAQEFVDRIIAGKKVATLTHGTPFQEKVWHALTQIPRSETRTYAQIARAIGAPKATRAVGTTCGRNRIAILIPCHRVIPTSGGVGNYRWGSARKERMLTSEQSVKK